MKKKIVNDKPVTKTELQEELKTTKTELQEELKTTKTELQEELKTTKTELQKELKKYATKKDLDKKLKRYATKIEIGIMFENFRSASKRDTEELLTQFRSDMFTRFDQIVGELAQNREDRLFINHEIRQLKETDTEHDNRIKKLEPPQPARVTVEVSKLPQGTQSIPPLVEIELIAIK